MTAASNKVVCTGCGKKHNGRFGCGSFCSTRCSKRVGARARWAGRNSSTATTAIANRSASVGLVGESVIIAKGNKKQAKKKGKLVKYEAGRDEHWLVRDNGNGEWVSLRQGSVEFVE